MLRGASFVARRNPRNARDRANGASSVRRTSARSSDVRPPPTKPAATDPPRSARLLRASAAIRSMRTESRRRRRPGSSGGAGSRPADSSRAKTKRSTAFLTREASRTEEVRDVDAARRPSAARGGPARIHASRTAISRGRSADFPASSGGIRVRRSRGSASITETRPPGFPGTIAAPPSRGRADSTASSSRRSACRPSRIGAMTRPALGRQNGQHVACVIGVSVDCPRSAPTKRPPKIHSRNRMRGL
jgi:hypothetical protein